MSEHRSRTRRAALPLVAMLATGGLILSAPPAGAIPFEGTPDPSACERLLVRAEEWPSRPSDNPRFVSDGFVLYLSRMPGCADSRG